MQPHSFNEYVADVSSIVAIKSNADGEIQIFNSKLVVGEAVDALNLAVSAQPVYFSFGRVIARIAQELGFRAYARGNGSIDCAPSTYPSLTSAARSKSKRSRWPSMS